jgi:branched-chain amino acid transport system ATP-binding protein
LKKSGKPTLPGDEDGRKPSHLVVEDLTAGYGGIPVIFDVSLRVGRGEMASIIGPNGAGKSTALKAIVGVIHTMSGRVSLAGNEITNVVTERLVQKGIGYVPQTKDIFGPMTVIENLMMGAYLLKSSEVPKRLQEVYEIFPLLADIRTRLANKLSGGERKMLAFGRALMLRPTALVLDEPTANLSPELSAVLLGTHVKKLADAGVAVLIVEQKARLAMEIVDWTYVLVNGRVQIAGAPQTLLGRPDFAEVMLGQVPAD